MEKENLNIGLTGSSGFLGSAIGRYLENNGESVFVLDGLVHPSAADTDVKVPETLDWVLHLGASKCIEASFENPVGLYRKNMHSTMAALDIALSRKVRFLYMSSFVYGTPRYLPVDEKHPTAVLNPYMGSKLLGEEMCYQLHQCMELSVLILRGFTIFGPEQKGKQLIPSIIEAIRSNRPILVKDPSPNRDYLYISDFVRLIGQIVRSNCCGFDIYNVGGGTSYNNLDVAEMANKLAGYPVPIQVEGKERRGDVAECCANIEKAKQRFEWEPEVDLETGLCRCLGLPLSVRG